MLIIWSILYFLIVILFYSKLSGTVQLVVGIPATMPPAVVPLLINKNRNLAKMGILGIVLAALQVVFQLFTPFAVEVTTSDFLGFLILFAFIGLGFTTLAVYSFVKLEGDKGRS